MHCLHGIDASLFSINMLQSPIVTLSNCTLALSFQIQLIQFIQLVHCVHDGLLFHWSNEHLKSSKLKPSLSLLVVHRRQRCALELGFHSLVYLCISCINEIKRPCTSYIFTQTVWKGSCLVKDGKGITIYFGTFACIDWSNVCGNHADWNPKMKGNGSWSLNGGFEYVYHFMVFECIWYL